MVAVTASHRHVRETRDSGMRVRSAPGSARPNPVGINQSPQLLLDAGLTWSARLSIVSSDRLHNLVLTCNRFPWRLAGHFTEIYQASAREPGEVASSIF